jgi:hypothetical protein
VALIRPIGRWAHYRYQALQRGDLAVVPMGFAADWTVHPLITMAWRRGAIDLERRVENVAAAAGDSGGTPGASPHPARVLVQGLPLSGMHAPGVAAPLMLCLSEAAMSGVEHGPDLMRMRLERDKKDADASGTDVHAAESHLGVPQQEGKDGTETTADGSSMVPLDETSGLVPSPMVQLLLPTRERPARIRTQPANCNSLSLVPWRCPPSWSMFLTLLMS